MASLYGYIPDASESRSISLLAGVQVISGSDSLLSCGDDGRVQHHGFRLETRSAIIERHVSLLSEAYVH